MRCKRWPNGWDWILRRWTPTIFRCVVIKNTTAERWRQGLERCGTLLSENIINGRPICLFKLAEPICVAHWRFTVVELPRPGEKRYPHEGWEHIEIVLPGDPETLNARAHGLAFR